MNRFTLRSRTLAAGTLTAAAVALVAAACSGGGTPTGGSADTGGSSSTVVQVRTVAGQDDVLTDAQGNTLYVSDQEASGEVLCTTNDCTAIWAPLTVPGGADPSGPSMVASHLGTVVRTDGRAQVTLDGTPLYTFTPDGGAGKTSGDGQSDSFGGTDFTWHTATTTGPASSTPHSNEDYEY